MTIPKKLEPRISSIMLRSTAEPITSPLGMEVLTLQAATRTADNLTALVGSAHRIANALETLLVKIDDGAFD